MIRKKRNRGLGLAAGAILLWSVAGTAGADDSPEQQTSRGIPVLDRVKVGAYGSVRLEGSNLDKHNTSFVFRRFVLTTDANIAPRMRAYLELEFERFRKLELEQNLEETEGGLKAENEVEGTSGSEIAIEQAWFEYAVNDALRFRAGGLLVPLGRFNLNHDDNRWNLPRRSLVDRGAPVLPAKSAWDELGMGFAGDLILGGQTAVGYQIYAMNGVALDFDMEEIAQTRDPKRDKLALEVKLSPSTGGFARDLKDEKAVAGRVAISPALGQELAVSGYFGRYTPDFLDGEDLWSVGIDGLTTHGPFELEGQWVYTRFHGIGDVARGLARVARDRKAEGGDPELETEVELELASLARRRQGYWLEARYRFWPTALDQTFLGRNFDNPELVAVLRGEQVWLDDLVNEIDFTGGEITNFRTNDGRVDRLTIGLAYRPMPLVAFQLAYEYTRADGGELSELTNFLAAQSDENEAHFGLFGVTFGF